MDAARTPLESTSSAGLPPEVAANLRNWEERVPIHLVGYGTDAFVADPHRLSDVARQDLALMAPHLPGGSLEGLDLLHLQCHIGTDTLSFARCGARVTGVDLSPSAITAARSLAERAGLAATFVESEVTAAQHAVTGTFDVVHTSIGALCWLPDLPAWGRTVAAMLRPGGLFFVRDGHPVMAALDDVHEDGRLVLARPYFGGTPERWYGDQTYVESDVRLTSTETWEWKHPLSEVVTVLLDAGLRITSLGEQDLLPWKAFPHMVEVTGEHGSAWALPGEQRAHLPLTFSLTATRDA
ncbi:class I SAM-dependent methyltransferase [Pseudokineococcus basanitobsidens]|uniref:Class I SAM-dependent methyltransferase n=1 Tax=Pseudokineococcus basanitobsidens TaxID=1926649 RepID=A0ABU8RFQ8_9ACTN